MPVYLTLRTKLNIPAMFARAEIWFGDDTNPLDATDTCNFETAASQLIRVTNTLIAGLESRF